MPREGPPWKAELGPAGAWAPEGARWCAGASLVRGLMCHQWGWQQQLPPGLAKLLPELEVPPQILKGVP